jgi:hypothetical protein
MLEHRIYLGPSLFDSTRGSTHVIPVLNMLVLVLALISGLISGLSLIVRLGREGVLRFGID